ncbi:MAG: hypothetical protein A3H98_04915 [Bacteroidetes bacterium RIFCSPLOWO2_02_FULL_36_8]|nr:MAG: hypothetical protein A3H98_04915 [Bacteroidetes bacterium RIFCSPLOWO2_02_FULL_36_8]
MKTDKIKKLEKISSALEPNQQRFNRMNKDISQWAEKFLIDLKTLPAHYTIQRRKKLPGWKKLLNKNPGSSKNLLKIFNQKIVNSGVNPASSGYVAYIPGGGVPWAALGDYMADISNLYSGAYFACPGAVELENRMISWMCHLLKFPNTAAGNITSGGSMANLIALVTARDKFIKKFKNQTNWVIYLSSQTHHSVEKSLRVIGLGDIKVRKIPMDKHFRMNTTILSDTISSDKNSGLHPWLVLGNAGTTDTGACDNLIVLSKICRKFNLWFHVDAAYGGFFLLSPQGKKIMKGINYADSVVMDPHKGLFLPYGIGAVLIRDKKYLMESFKYKANYMHDIYREEEELYPSLLSPELTRPFRAMRMWLTIHFAGMKALKASIEEKILLARYFYERIKKIPFIEAPLPPDFSVVLFRYNDGMNDPDTMTQRFLKLIRKEKSFYISSTLIEGHVYLRLAVLCFRTHLIHVDKVLDTMLKCRLPFRGIV